MQANAPAFNTAIKQRNKVQNRIVGCFGCIAIPIILLFWIDTSRQADEHERALRMAEPFVQALNEVRQQEEQNTLPPEKKVTVDQAIEYLAPGGMANSGAARSTVLYTLWKPDFTDSPDWVNQASGVWDYHCRNGWIRIVIVNGRVHSVEVTPPHISY